MGLYFRIAFARLAAPSVLLAVGLTTVSAAATLAARPAETALPAVTEPVEDERALLVRERHTGVEDAPPAEAPAAAPPPPAPAPPVLAVPRLAPIDSAAGSRGFIYGYCTWWVATKRPIPWSGDAIEWLAAARQFGFEEGQQPQVGAIMVVGPGGGASWLGHVAYVESVRPDGSFVVSEMNWGKWAVVAYRTITSRQGILGFIY